MDTPSLPDILSETLSLAISDARRLDRSDYHPHHHFWHDYEDARCQVCLTGSIMAQTLKVDKSTSSFPRRFPDDIYRKLVAVNFCRRGQFHDAFYFFHGFLPSYPLQDRLSALPVPSEFLFIGWNEFDRLLSTLESIVPTLSEIELEAL